MLISPADLFETERTLPHGHVEAILGTIRKIGLDTVISSKRCPERDLVLAMIVERLIHPCSKLATTRLWHTTTLAEELSVQEADENDLYEAMDWLLTRQERIEKKLAERHLTDGAMVLYDVSSSYYKGRKCPLAKLGHDRDGQKGLPIIVYGVLTDNEGRPVAVSVYRNTGDPTTVPDQVDKVRQKFELSHLILVGDRGMLTQPQINKLKAHPGIGWITALTSVSIRKLVRPIQHRTEDRVPAHIFLCMLAYYVEWHMRKALAPIFFEDDQLESERKRRDPILPAKPSEAAKRKKATHMTPDGLPVHSLETLMAELASRCRNTYKLKNDDSSLTFSQVPVSTALQKRAYELLGLFPVSGK